MKAIRRDHQVPTMLQTIIVFSLILNRVAAEFYIGEYHHTSVHDSGGRNQSKRQTPFIIWTEMTAGETDGSHDDDNEESNELFAARSNKRGGHGQPRQSSAKMEERSLSAFNPLTPGGTIYLAFIFLIPLTVGKTHLGRGKSSSSLSKSSSSSSGLLERLIDKVQQDQQSLYSEMGYVDGNLMLRKGWRDLRDTLAKKLRLLPWRRRFHDNNDDANSQKNRRKKKKWKSWMDRRNDR
ncbi:hypothetical protein GHT06_013997 [Daphnia sinensis]|uniref:Uncharacterized protein n=1 Tax=Daphnia sinensis TaxID=1820382 RepID=A0AAD5KUU8_9CRUS|nr:hypothetical protein GHT06_013997 [Daphnia sinensis]